MLGASGRWRACARGRRLASRRGFLACLVVAWPALARGYRPFDFTDAAVTGKGDMELELGPLGYVKEGPDQLLVAPGLVLNWGFAERWEMVIEGRQLVQLGSASRARLRLQDTALSVKHVLRDGDLQGRKGLSVASELSALLPEVHGASRAGAEWTLIASRRWPALTVHGNVAAAWTRAQRVGLFGAIILEGHDAWPVRPVAEVFVEREGDLPAVLSGLVGAVWQAREDLAFDAAVRLARTGGVDALEMRVGLTWAFSVGLPGEKGPPRRAGKHAPEEK